MPADLSLVLCTPFGVPSCNSECSMLCVKKDAHGPRQIFSGPFFNPTFSTARTKKERFCHSSQCQQCASSICCTYHRRTVLFLPVCVFLPRRDVGRSTLITASALLHHRKHFTGSPFACHVVNLISIFCYFLFLKRMEFLRVVEEELRALAAEARRRHPVVKEAAERCERLKGKI